MNGGVDTLTEAIEWLLREARRTPYGRLSIGVQLHGGQIAKVFKSVEESTLASQTVRERVEDGRS